MTEVLWIESDPRVAADLPYPVTSARQALAEWSGDEQLDVIVLGTTVSEPVRLARSLRTRDDLVEILIACRGDAIEALEKTLSFDPLVGTHTRAVDASGDLEEVVAEAGSETSRRRQHRHTLSSAQAAIDASASPARRPSPLHYAATMWSESPVGALAIVRSTKHIVSANRAATELIGQDELDLIGQRLDEVLSSFEGEAEAADPAGIDVEGEHVDRVVTCETSDGEMLHFEARVVDVGAPARDVVLVFLWDITERVHLEQVQHDYLAAEKKAREAADQASRAREEVLATVSHDLRSPLQTLVTASELLDGLSELHDDPTIAGVGARVERAADYMTRLVGDLLDIARMEDGRLSLDYSHVQVDHLVKQAVELTSGLAADAGVRVEAAAVSESVVLNCDKTRVIQLLQNLLSNAIKFSPEGQVVTVDVAQRDQMVQFTISDDGPGISADKLPRLFERFWQADRRDKSGLGLGLAIVHGIVEAHGGDITVDSAQGEGTTFVIELPLAAP